MKRDPQQIVGVLPMAGSGSRLGLPFPKPLAPIVVGETIRPLYSFALARIQRVTTTVIGVVSPAGAKDPYLAELPFTLVAKPEQGELPTSLSFAAKSVAPNALIAVALPDTVWYPEDLFDQALEELVAYPDVDGITLCFRGDRRQLDEVTIDGQGKVRNITLHLTLEDEPGEIVGWGALLLRAGAVANLTDDQSLASQLAGLNLRAVVGEGPFLDFGTPERYLQGLISVSARRPEPNT
ncbi:MAG: NTP transferase domain-containing protein [Candidatus Limnocylindrus sp.]